MLSIILLLYLAALVGKIAILAEVCHQKQMWFWHVYSQHKVKDSIPTKQLTPTMAPHLNEPLICLSIFSLLCTMWSVLSQKISHSWEKQCLRPHKQIHLKIKIWIDIRWKSLKIRLPADIGLYLALSTIDFVHWRLYNSYFAFGAHWNFPSTDARP